jgi:hypothetical protein
MDQVALRNSIAVLGSNGKTVALGFGADATTHSCQEHEDTSIQGR